MKKLLTLFIILSILFAPSVYASHVNILGILSNWLTNPNNSKAIGDGQTIATSEAFTSAADTSIGRSNYMSLQYRIRSGTAPDVTFSVLTSGDESNFVAPETGATIKANVNDLNWHHSAISVPVCRAIKVKATNNSANSCVVDFLLLSQ